MKHQLSPSEIRAAISAIDEQHNLWRTFVSLAEYEIADALNFLAPDDLSNEKSQYYRGWLAHARQFRATLDEVMEQAKKLK